MMTIEQAESRIEWLVSELAKRSLMACGRFWLCLKCKNVVHSHNQVHPCKACGNTAGSGWWTSTDFETWKARYPDDFKTEKTSVRLRMEEGMLTFGEETP